MLNQSKEDNIKYVLDIYREFLKNEFPNHTFELTDYDDGKSHRAFKIKIDNDIVMEGPVHCQCIYFPNINSYEDIDRLVKTGWCKSLKYVILHKFPDLLK